METTASEPPALPAVERPRTLDPSVVRLWRVSGAIWTAILTLAAVALYVFLGDEAPVWVRVVPATLVLAYGIFYVAVWVPKAYRAWEFEIRDADVRLRHGVLWRRTSVVPHARIQHVDTRHGPLTRAYGLASIVLKRSVNGCSLEPASASSFGPATASGASSDGIIGAAQRT